ncbi:hypothetical protein Tco_0454308 [Tanacetum coccineum]
MKYNEKTGVYSCQVDEQWFDLSADLLRKALAITPVIPAHPFEFPPSGNIVIDFVNELVIIHNVTPPVIAPSQMSSSTNRHHWSRTSYNQSTEAQQSPQSLLESLHSYRPSAKSESIRIHELENQESEKSPKGDYQKPKRNKVRETRFHLRPSDEDAWIRSCRQVKDHKRKQSQPPPKDDDQSLKKPRESDASASKQHPALTTTGWQINDTRDTGADSSMHRSDPESEHSEQSSDDIPMQDEGNDSDTEDTDNAYIPKVSTTMWFKPIPESERPATPEPEWTIPPNDFPNREKNTANTYSTTK